MILPKNFCAAPFTQITTHPSGSHSPCPYLGGTTWGASNSSIHQLWTGDSLEKLRAQFLNNEQPTVCSRCWHEEQNGKRSLRLRFYDHENKTSDFEFINEDLVNSRLSDSGYKTGPVILTIKNGNVCNAKCRVCHPNDSSRWIPDSQKLFEITRKKHYALDQIEMNWSDAQVDEIVSLSSNLQRLELFGGEPTYNKRVAVILRKLVECGVSKNITLYVNTNGSVDILDRWDFLDQFKSVELGVSFDGVGAHFNYIRHGCDYTEAVKNVKSWQRYFIKNKIKFSIDSISTVSILNVYYLSELKAAVRKFLPLFPFWNLLVTPAHLFIKNMPDYVKAAVIDKLSEDEEEFCDIISVIQQPADLTAWDEFLKITHGLDQIRGESFADTFPEFAEIIRYK